MKLWFILALRSSLAFFSFLVVVLPVIASDTDWAAAEQAAREQNFELAVAKATALISAGDARPEMFYQRGRWNFRLGRIDESLADFDRFIAQRPELMARLWERGITCYYAQEFRAGSKQFEQYQTYYSNDVENAVWRYLCQAQFEGREKAREAILPIRFDARVPMMEVYELFRGRALPDTVLARLTPAADDEDIARQRRFNAHLYLALYYDSEGDLPSAQRHIDQAVKQYTKGDYMWAVAKHHQQHLRTRAKRPAVDSPETNNK